MNCQANYWDRTFYLNTICWISFEGFQPKLLKNLRIGVQKYFHENMSSKTFTWTFFSCTYLDKIFFFQAALFVGGLLALAFFSRIFDSILLEASIPFTRVFLGQLFLTYASTSITYWVPLIVITILYIHIYKVAKNLKKKKMLRTANAAPAHRPPAIDKSRKRSPSSPNVITAHGGMLEFVHIERGMKTRQGSIESNNHGFPG